MLVFNCNFIELCLHLYMCGAVMRDKRGGRGLFNPMFIPIPPLKLRVTFSLGEGDHIHNGPISKVAAWVVVTELIWHQHAAAVGTFGNPEIS